MRRIIILVCFFVLGSCAYNEFNPCENTSPSFDIQIRTIFEDNCISCHNTGNSSGSLALETYQDISDAVLNGQVLYRINLMLDDPLLMPVGDKLSTEEIQLITEWKNNGACNN